MLDLQLPLGSLWMLRDDEALLLLLLLRQFQCQNQERSAASGVAVTVAVVAVDEGADGGDCVAVGYIPANAAGAGAAGMVAIADLDTRTNSERGRDYSH